MGRIFNSGAVAGWKSFIADWVVVEQSGVMVVSFSPWIRSSGRFLALARPALTCSLHWPAPIWVTTAAKRCGQRVA